MQRGLLAILLIVLAMEIWGIIMMAHWIGGWATFVLLIATGFLGVWVIRVEGGKVWQQAQRQMQAGQVPGHTLLEGLCVLAGGIMLMAPGFFSDIIGISLLLPVTRPLYRLWLYRWLERKIRSGNFSIYRGPRR
ncbi:FxsA family protein [Cohnella silvisoli]|uniref:FxsA family protein n=1 Tax=Cohnella silvisoli TaxID=2873699 RepID=A0ABV1L1P5_9BACL|nr:FxsA family protein [Cohnella silvisoli]MCD9025927.1 FxsA family protein [Cohnella silvisoli]